MTDKIDLLSGQVNSTLRHFASPLIISFLINMVYSWVDLFYVSYLGDNAIAALGISERIWFFMFAVGSGMAIGSSIIAAKRIGENRPKEAGHVMMASIVYMSVFGILSAIALYSLLPSILWALGIVGEPNKLALIYFKALIIGIPGNYMLFHLTSLIRAAGNSLYPMIIMIASNVINAILTPLLMFGYANFSGVGIIGAGIGTSSAQYFGVIFALIILFSGKIRIKPKFVRNFADFKLIGRIMNLGVPASLQLVAISIGSMGIAVVANQFGTDVLATYIIGLRVDLFVGMLILAVGSAIEIIVSQNTGAGNFERILEYYKSALIQISVLLVFLGIVVFFGGERIAGIFTRDKKILLFVGEYLKISSLTYIPFAIGTISVRVISGKGNYFRSFVIVTSVLLGFQLPVVYFMSKFFQDYHFIWIGMGLTMIFYAFWGFREIFSKNLKKV